MKNLKILMIGNSYSEDTAQYLSGMAGVFDFEEVELYTLTIGGGSLENHYDNSLSNKAAYYFKCSQNEKLVSVGSGKTLEYGITYKDWDFITLQQSSKVSGDPSTYNADLTGLISYVKSKATNPDVQLVWNMTWSYANTYSGIASNGYKDQEDMYNAIVDAVQQKIVTNPNFVEISPAGTAIQNARTSSLGDTLNRDGTHLTYTTGRYIAGLSLFCKITGYSVDAVTYAPSGMSATEVSIAKESVKNALANKFEITRFPQA